MLLIITLQLQVSSSQIFSKKKMIIYKYNFFYHKKQLFKQFIKRNLNDFIGKIIQRGPIGKNFFLLESINKSGSTYATVAKTKPTTCLLFS